MSDVIIFVPRDDIDAAANLHRFISQCRNELTAFGKDLPFDATTWDVSKHIRIRGRQSAITLTFSKWKPSRTTKPEDMGEPFGAFARAFMRYMHATRKVVTVSHRLTALRILEHTLLEETGTANPVNIATDTLNRAAQLTKKHFAATSAYTLGRTFEEINTFLVEHRLVAARATWVNPLKQPGKTNNRVGKEFDERRQEKLPSPRAIEALGHIYRNGTDPSDIVVTSISAIMFSAPDRCAEIMELPYDCEVRDKDPKTGEETYGLRWWPAKGAEPMVKWFGPTMREVVKDAIERIRKSTDEGRRIAKWYEDHPTQIYLPEHLEHLRKKEWISMAESNQVLWLNADYLSTANWMKAQKLETIKIKPEGSGIGKGKGSTVPRSHVRFACVQCVVLRWLPKEFPYMCKESGLKFSDALFVTSYGLLDDSRSTSTSMFAPVTYSQVQMRLNKTKANNKTIFEKHGYTEDDGTFCSITTHQPRHYLSTLAETGNLSELDIAKWAGRRDVKQNQAYNHVSGRALINELRDAIGNSNKVVGPLAKPRVIKLISRDEFARLKIPTAHTTELGYCIHDFTMTPCPLHRDCISCEEQICVKGDKKREKAIRVMRDQTEGLLGRALKANGDKEAGANRWVEHQQNALERLNQLCSIFDDDTVADGSFIQLSSPKIPSRIEQARQARAQMLGDDLKRLDRTAERALPTPSGDVEEEP